MIQSGKSRLILRFTFLLRDASILSDVTELMLECGGIRGTISDSQEVPSGNLATAEGTVRTSPSMLQSKE
jgi:hypothetical protein